jgi:hypothetical protein
MALAFASPRRHSYLLTLQSVLSAMVIMPRLSQHDDCGGVFTSATIHEDSIVFNGSSGVLDAQNTADTFGVVGQKGMIEMVFKYVSGSVFLQSPASSGVAMGVLNSTTILPFSGTGGSAAGLSFPSSLRSLTNTVSVGYTSTKPVTTSYYLNGARASTASGSYWGSPGSVTYIGRRASGATASVVLYSIRLYDRHLSAACARGRERKRNA